MINEPRTPVYWARSVAVFKQERPKKFTQGSVPKRAAPRSVRLALTEEEFEGLGRLAKETGLRDKARLIRWLVDVWEAVQKEAAREGAAIYDSDEPSPQLGILHTNQATGKASFRKVKLPDGWGKG